MILIGTAIPSKAEAEGKPDNSRLQNVDLGNMLQGGTPIGVHIMYLHRLD